MKHILKKLMAVFLTALTVFGSLGSDVYAAFTSGTGEYCESYIGSYYVGSDGYYYSFGETTPGESHYEYIMYDDDMNVTYSYTDIPIDITSTEHARQKWMMKDADGNVRQAYCIEVGVDFGEASMGNGYVSENAENSEYFNGLSYVTQYNIMLATLYGYAPGKQSPVAGTNIDDYAFATQIIIWEFQQGLRTNATSRHDNAWGVPADMQYLALKGRPAEKCYNWILNQMANHGTGPSFTKTLPSTASTYTLKYDSASKTYKLTLTDSNNTLKDIKFEESTGITVTRSGNKYTFTSKSQILTAQKLTVKKDVSGDTSACLIWGMPGAQTMITGCDDPVAFYMNINTETYGTGRIVKTSEDGKVSCIKFTISGNNQPDKTVTTGADGTVSLPLLPGTYTVTETADDRYVQPAARTITVENRKTATVTFSNTLKRGSLEVTKTAEDGLVEGIKFHLYGTSLSGLEVDEYAVTDADGMARFENVLISGSTTYTLEEVETNDKYVVPASQTVAIEWNKVTKRSFTNILKKFNVTVTKTDAETGSAQGDAALAGAVYGIYKDGSLIDTYTTDENGRFTTDYYACGNDYTIKEITPPEGYELDTTVYKVGAEASNFTTEINALSLTVKEDIIKGSIAIIKHSDDGSTKIETPEEGAVFEVYLKSSGSYGAAKDSEKDLLVCDEDGFAQTKALPYGTYTVHQTKGLPGRELMSDFDVEISQSCKTYKYLINNADFYSYVKIEKTDAETGKTIPYAGAGFKIYDTDGKPVTMKITYPEIQVLDTFYTNEGGYLITPGTLPTGTGYSIVEVSAPEGYVLDSTPVYFDVTGDGTEDIDGINVVTVIRSDIPQKGTITITKTGEIFSSVSYDETTGCFTPVYAVSGLENAVYEIYAAEDITTPEGTIRYAEGELVDTITTGVTGTAVSKELYLGTYEVIETTAPYGYVLDRAPKSVTIEYAGENVSVTNAETETYNERQKLYVSLIKAMEQNSIFDIGTGEELLDVTFGLYAAEDIEAADGSILPADGLIETINAAIDGTAQVQSDLPFGSYYLKELTTNPAYVLDKEVYPVVFAYEGQEIQTVNAVINDGEAIENNIFYGTLKGIKTDPEGKPLKSAVFGLFKADETDLVISEALMTAVSADDGTFLFDHVPYGTYRICELEAPYGYIRSVETVTVSVTQDPEDEETDPVTFVNEPVSGTLTIVKTGEDGKPLEGAEFEICSEGGEPVAAVVTDKNGTAEINGLELGRYTVVETKAPEGYLISLETYTVNIEYADQETPVVEVTLEVTDEKEPPTEDVHTGDTVKIKRAVFFAALAAIVIAIVAVNIVFRKRRMQKHEYSFSNGS